MNWSFFHVYFDFKELIKASHRISPLGFYCVCFEIEIGLSAESFQGL